MAKAPLIPVFLAQSGPQQMASALLWLGVLVAVAVLIVIVGLAVRRRFQDDSDAPASDMSVGFTLEDLRQMRQAGQLTQEEFAAARAKMIARGRAVMREDHESAEQSTDLPPADPGDADLGDDDEGERPDNRPDADAP